MLRSVAVLFSCAFVLRFIALESLYSPGRGLLKRVMTTVLEGVTLGSLDYVPVGASTGYAAFAALMLYMIGLVLVGARDRAASGTTALVPMNEDEALMEQRPSSGIRPVNLVVIATILLTACVGLDDAPSDARHSRAVVDQSERERALASAFVWRPPAVPIGLADFTTNPSRPNSFGPTDTVACRFVPDHVNGMTPKFRCELPSGEIVKVKYGRRNPEVYAEVATTRLLAALGFGADEMYLVGKITCIGCPQFPFPALKCHAYTGARSICFAGALDNDPVHFEPAVIERRMPGRVIESRPDEGWAWYELDRIDPRIGSPRRELDALRLLAVVLSHWDNKSENQRLICPPDAEGPNGSCARPFALIQDLGSTFGPKKLDLVNWRRSPVWKDRRACTVSMKHLPFDGATFPDEQISEDGRLMLLDLLEQLSEAQLRSLFLASRITTFDAVPGEGRDPGAWARAFREKVRQVREAGPCPTRSPAS